MIEIRRFTPSGVQEFERRLKLMKSNQDTEITSIISSEAFTEHIGSVEAPPLPDPAGRSLEREEVGIYFNYVLSFVEDSISNIESDIGLWTWLSARYFDVVCPLNQKRERKVGDLSRYIFNPDSFQKYYRHLLNGPYRITRRYRDNIEVARVVLATSVGAPGEAVEQITSRQEFISNSALLALATSLYIDPNTRKHKLGSGSNTGGTPRRFGTVLAQLDRTWDTESMTTDQLIELLPKEFDRFLP